MKKITHVNMELVEGERTENTIKYEFPPASIKSSPYCNTDNAPSCETNIVVSHPAFSSRVKLPFKGASGFQTFINGKRSR